MFKTPLLIMVLAATVYSAEISPSYSSSEKHATFNPDMKSEPIKHTIPRVEKSDENHPVYRAAEIKNQGRARIEPIRPRGPVIKHEAMLADQPPPPTELTRSDSLDTGNGYSAVPVEIAYPDIPYAPGYFYDTGYSAPNNYDMYGPSTYLMDPDTSTFSLLWSQVPDGRTLVSYVGRTILWVFNSVFVLFLGSLLTVGVCSYTNLCTIAFTGIGPIHEEMRSLISPERLEKISHAADFVKTAIDKYQKIQKVTDGMPVVRRRRAIFNK